ncbi:alpha/beta hydrolase [Microcoleus sp. FACHB-831]|uniref:alpha/beta fold hydrolase n=1 Tax=Microcoleus sp. FACHB-831 TaxID=2692827 RepID=UPI001689D61C|nr:alpha/beta hydrolase [Microcoleus sp. FACHB-831]MBD1920967.1 alpha/beta hydrolase [Microcoleus sp. FACHB-831]
MFAAFLPDKCNQLRDSTCITTVQSLKQIAITTPLSDRTIATNYYHQGKGGTPILLLHGFDSSLLEFFRLLPLLAAHNETLAVDLFGFGFTERSPGIQFSPATIKSHLFCFWKTLINQPMILVGASMGGAAAIDFALAHPSCVKKLVLINSTGYSGGFPFGQFLFPPFEYWAVEWWRFLKLQTLANARNQRNPDHAYLDAVLCATLPMDMPGWYEAILGFTKSGAYNIEKDIAKIDKPTLILWGEGDNMLGTADAEKFKRAIARSELIWISNSGHVPQFEQAEITAKHILAFAC